MKSKEEYQIPLEKLKKVCKYEDELAFCRTSGDVTPLEGIVGQERAVKSMQFGLNMETNGYNIFVVGPSGTGKSAYAKEVVSQMAAKKPVPDDWCYIYNFSNSDKPLAVSLPAGRGREFQRDMDRLIQNLKNGIRKVFESSDYELKKDRILNSVQEKMEELYHIIEQKAFEDGFSVKQEDLKFVFVPLRYGRPMLPEEFIRLSEKEHQEIDEKRHNLGKHLDKILYDVQIFEKRITEQILELDKETTYSTAEPFVQSLKEKYSTNTMIVEYLGKVLSDVAERNIIFKNSNLKETEIAYFASQKENEKNDEPTESEYGTTKAEHTASKTADAEIKATVKTPGVQATIKMPGMQAWKKMQFGMAESEMPESEMPESAMQDDEGTFEPLAALTSQEGQEPFTRYKVNLFINNENQKGAPVIIEANPYYYSLFGKIEYRSQILVMNTDFTMIKPGAIQLANGGYLILQAKDLFNDPFVWDALKKAIKYRQAVIENIGEQYRTVPTVTLKPEPMALDVKVILIGSPIYYLILSRDEEFKKLFKVKVDFDYEMLRNQENLHKYVSFVGEICREKGMKHFDQSGLAGIIEYGSRLAEDQNKLSTQFDAVSEIVYEAIACAKNENAEYVDMSHVKKAINERKYRFNKLEEKIQAEVLQKRIIIDTVGNAVGQVNGLFIMEAEGYSFGLPARITAVTHVGRSGVLDIERETEMSGNIHSKGVLTLAGYLGGKLAQEKPLGFTAQVTFEQVYEGVEGDSASSAELYAIISSLAGIALKQSIAVTGSVDQRGEIQPIGGINEKIEGFFDICSAEGLTGEQGVMIPARNIDNLMLKDEILEAVRKDTFHIYAISNIEEGIEILSGLTAGKISENGKYPEGSVFYFVDQKLQAYNKALEEMPPERQ